MEVVVLGTAAGGGFPQWNCGCNNCEASRRDPVAMPARMQSSLAVSADGRTWHVVNASSDVARQCELHLRGRAALRGERDSPVASVLLTNADLDHCLGIFQLREGPELTVYAPDGVRRALIQGLNAHEVLSAYCGVRWEVSGEDWRVIDAAGLQVRAVPLRGAEAPRYFSGVMPTEACQGVGYLFRDRADGPVVGIFPDVAVIDEPLMAELAGCARVFFDGTFWSGDEMVALGFSQRDARAMGHVPMGGRDGSLAVLGGLVESGVAVSYVHINNTNPVLRPDSAERAAVIAAGGAIAEDGESFCL